MFGLLTRHITLPSLPQGRRACPDLAVLSDAGRGGLPLQSAPESCPDPTGRGKGGTRRTGADYSSSRGGAEVRPSKCNFKKLERIQSGERLEKMQNIYQLCLDNLHRICNHVSIEISSSTIRSYQNNQKVSALKFSKYFKINLFFFFLITLMFTHSFLVSFQDMCSLSDCIAKYINIHTIPVPPVCLTRQVLLLFDQLMEMAQRQSHCTVCCCRGAFAQPVARLE